MSICRCTSYVHMPIYIMDMHTKEVSIRIVHPESVRSNTQITIAFVRRNRQRVNRNDEFACVYLHSCGFCVCCVCEYCSQSTACAYALANACKHTYMRAYIRAQHELHCVVYKIKTKK